MATTVHVDANGGTRYSVIVTKGLYSGTGSAVYPGFWVNQNCVFGAIRYLRADGSNADSRSSITSGVTGIDGYSTSIYTVVEATCGGKL